MTRGSKILLGILSFLPFVLLIFYLGAIFTFVTEMMAIQHTGEKPDPIFVWTRVSGVIVWAILLGLLSLGLKIYYIIHAVNNKAIESSERLVWVLIFVFVGLIGYPIYWVLRVWGGPTTTAPTS